MKYNIGDKVLVSDKGWNRLGVIRSLVDLGDGGAYFVYIPEINDTKYMYAMDVLGLFHSYKIKNSKLGKVLYK